MALIFQWAGNGLSAGTLTTESAGSGDTAPTQITLNNASATIVETDDRSPAIQLKEAALGASAFVDWGFDTTAEVSMRGYFTPTTALATTHAIFSIRAAVAKTRVADVIITSAGAVRIYDVDNAFTPVGSNGTIVTGTTYRFEVTLDTISSTLNFKLYEGHNTTPFIAVNNVVGNFYSDGIGWIRLGKNTTSPQAETQVWDDLIVTTGTSFIGPAVEVTRVSAGLDQTQIEPYSTVVLYGSVLNGSVSSWTWTQLSGTPVALSGTGAARSFTAPANPNTQTLEFQVTGDSESTDTVLISVNPHLEWIKTPTGTLPIRPGHLS